MPALLIPIYALADRIAGGGASRLDARLPGRALLWMTLLAALVGYFVAGWAAVLLALAWGLHRSLPFRLFGGSAAPEGGTQIMATLLRYSLIVPAVGIVAAGFDLPILRALGLAFLFAAVATTLAAWYGGAVAEARGRRLPIGDQNVYIELIRGAAFGAMVWGVLA